MVWVSAKERELVSTHRSDPGQLNKSIGRVTRERTRLRITCGDKLLRAHGGCLGVNCRRRTRYTAKSLGEVCATDRAEGIRMGKPARGNARASVGEHIANGGEPGELKHLSTRRKREDSLSSGERKGRSPNRTASRSGLEGNTEGCGAEVEGSGKANRRG